MMPTQLRSHVLLSYIGYCIATCGQSLAISGINTMEFKAVNPNHYLELQPGIILLEAFFLFLLSFFGCETEPNFNTKGMQLKSLRD